MHRFRLLAALAVLALALACAGTAWAHEPMTSNGVTVTLHVDPDDAPVAGRPATVLFEEVRVPKGTAFAWRTCACTLAVTAADGTPVRKGALATRAAQVVFPAPGAYEIALAGRVRRGTAWKAFRVAWAIRADAAQ